MKAWRLFNIFSIAESTDRSNSAAAIFVVVQMPLRRSSAPSSDLSRLVLDRPITTVLFCTGTKYFSMGGEPDLICSIGGHFKMVNIQPLLNVRYLGKYIKRSLCK